MLLDRILENSHLGLQYLERYVHFREYTDLSHLGELKEKYSSFLGKVNTTIKFYRIPKSIVSYFSTNNQDNRILLESSDEVLVPLHPQVEEDNILTMKSVVSSVSNGYEEVQGIPTASGRTFFLPSLSKFVKTSFPLRISSSLREINFNDINRSNWISNEIIDSENKKILPNYLGFLIEEEGVFIKSNKTEVGAISRDSNPFPYAEDKRMLIPLFSLYSVDYKNPTDKSLLEQLSEKKYIAPEEYMIENIIKPFLNAWSWLVLEKGIILDSHGQNTLLEFSNNWNLERIIFRDFDRRKIHRRIRREKGLEIPKLLFIEEREENISNYLSLVYDFYIGRVLFERLIDSLELERGPRIKLEKQIKTLFHEVFREKSDIFPNEQYIIHGSGLSRRMIESQEKVKFR